jgi:hypothetical protein
MGSMSGERMMMVMAAVELSVQLVDRAIFYFL